MESIPGLFNETKPEDFNHYNNSLRQLGTHISAHQNEHPGLPAWHNVYGMSEWKIQRLDENERRINKCIAKRKAAILKASRLCQSS